jgi:hypothetical protein
VDAASQTLLASAPKGGRRVKAESGMRAYGARIADLYVLSARETKLSSK